MNIDQYLHAERSFTLALEDPVRWCASGRCLATNWGGTDRAHVRGTECPDFNEDEMLDLLGRAKAGIARHVERAKAREAAEVQRGVDYSREYRARTGRPYVFGQYDNAVETLVARWTTQELADDGYTHRDGTWWDKAPLPPRRHRCSPWTTGWSGLTYVERCACGSLRMSPYPGWSGKNSRRVNDPPESWRPRPGASPVTVFAVLVAFLLVAAAIFVAVAWS